LKISAERLNTLQVRLQTNYDLLVSLINEHGEVIALHEEKQSEKSLIHDYFFFALSKGTKTLSSIDFLLSEGSFEDANILIRSCYECYLNSSFVLNNPKKVHELLLVKIGLERGRLHHPLSNRGKPKLNKIISPETGLELDFGVSIFEMSRSTLNSTDKIIHTSLYKFLSEYVHVHIMTSGSYRTDSGDWYTVETKVESSVQSIMMGLYVSWLLLDLALSYLEDSENDVFIYDMHLENTGEMLLELFTEADFSENLTSLKQDLINRISG
jgi:hypothetical protein